MDKKKRKRDKIDRFDDIDRMDDDFMDDETDRKKGWVPVVFALFMILVVAGIVVGMKLYEKYSYSKAEMSLSEYYGIEQEWQVPMIVGDEVVEDQAVLRNGDFYLPLAFVQEQLNDKFYYDRHEKLLLFTTPTELYEIPVDSAAYMIAGAQQSYDKAVWILQDEVPYVELEFVMQYADFLCRISGQDVISYEGMSEEGGTEQPRLQIYLAAETKQTATIRKDTAVRYQGGVKSDILKAVDKGDKVYILEQMENWSKVKTEDSVIGYIENKRLEEAEDAQIVLPGTYVAPVYSTVTRPYPINLAWHQVTNAVANSGIDAMLENTSGINTISPTWFFLNDNQGNFTSIADQTYVDKMHAKGIEVWVLIDNFTNDVDIAQILSTTTNRKNLINNLVQTTLAYGMDGINIDFEQVPQEAGADYVQFLRELSIPCRANGIVLSADNYVPTDYTAHYGRAEQGEVLDYFIIMGYDEHYSGSSQAGSVASYNYVKTGIENTLKDVPAHKVINAIPFYTRLWKISQEGVSSDALSMSAAENVLAQYGVTPEWDEETMQHFAQFEADGATYQIWLENAESIRAKLSLMSSYNIAGVAEWKLGLEKAEIWSVIGEYLQGVQISGEANLPVQTGEGTAPEMQVIETD